MRVVSQTALIFFEKFKSFFPIPPVLLNRREEEQIKNIIKWFVLLMHKDMQNFEMNEDTDCSVRKQIMNRTNRKKEGERLG